tara:strand:- start:133 stop:1596 length:1464 start_codon:yes stop_codon:yes gene_type:complete
MATTLEVSYFNTFWLKRVKKYVQNDDSGLLGVGSGGVTRGTPAADIASRTVTSGYIGNTGGTATNITSSINVFEDWFIEESRIRGGYNNTSVDFGVKAYIVEDEPQQQTLGNSLIYSGVLNSRTGVNNTNQFPIGEAITRSVDPISGSIQKLYAENTNLIILQERKVNRAPIDKDLIYTAEGQPITTATGLVIGTISAFEGNWGISRDPGSFAVHGYNKYFTDRDRSAVLKLGQSGIEQISNTGMIDYFRDTLAENDEGIIGGYDIYNKNYVLTLGNPYVTLAYDEIVKGWTSFFSYIPELTTSCLGHYYSFKNNALWKHYDNTLYNVFYGVNNKSHVTFVFNPQPTRMKTFKTLNYTGSNGWAVVASQFVSEPTGTNTNPQQPALGLTTSTDTNISIRSFDEGYYIDPNTQIGYRSGFDRKQNTYYAALKGANNIMPMQVIGDNGFGASNALGIKGFYATVKLQMDNTDPGGRRELFSVGTVYNNR